MKTFLAVLVIFSGLLAWEVRADSNGVEILPWHSPGDAASGVVSVNPDGTATVTGQLQGVPFVGSGTVTRNPDGSWVFTLYSDGDLLVRQKTWVPLRIHYTGDSEDATDGDPDDDDVGTIEVRSQSGTGTGEIQLNG